MTAAELTKVLSISIVSGMGTTTAIWMIAYCVRFLLNLLKGG